MKNFLVFTGILFEIDDAMAEHSAMMDPVPEGLSDYIKKWKEEDEGTFHTPVYGTIAIEQDNIYDINDYYPGHCSVRTQNSSFILKGTTIDIFKYICENYKEETK